MPIDRQTTFSGTKEVAAALRCGAAGSLPRRAVPDFKGPLDVKQFKGGQSNPTYLLETPARRYVLRRKPPGKLLPSAHAVDREFRVISALHAQGFPVAEPVLYCADESVVGTPFYVMDYVDGRVFWEPHMPGAEPARARRGLRRDERDAGAAAQLRSGGASASPISAAARTTSPARSSAGPSNTAPRRPRRSTRWSG